MSKFKRQINKGLLEIAVLKTIVDGDKYGYEIIKLIHASSGGNIELKDGTLYPILYRLEDNKQIESYWGEGSGLRAKPRKYYRVTDAGRKYYAESLNDYEQTISSMNMILKGDFK